MTAPTTGLVTPTVGTGVLMAAYLLLRPYGDAGSPTGAQAAAAFASPWWVVAHLCGALALASAGRLALRLSDAVPGVLARTARWTGLAGAVLVLPYYGAEMFGLHVLGRAAVAGDPSVLALVTDVRDQPVALATFGLGLLLLAASGLLLAAAWQESAGSVAAWPLGVMLALVLPQFYLPPVARMLFGVLYAVAAAVFLVAVLRGSHTAARGPREGAPSAVPAA